MTTKKHLRYLLEELPESALPEAERLLEGLRNGDVGLPRVFREAPWDDEPETEEERAAVQEAYEAIAQGDVYTLEEVKRELGL